MFIRIGIVGDYNSDSPFNHPPGLHMPGGGPRTSVLPSPKHHGGEVYRATYTVTRANTLQKPLLWKIAISATAQAKAAVLVDDVICSVIPTTEPALPAETALLES